MEKEHDSKPHKGFAFSSLEAVRKKLIDLSNRNNLLNYRHPKASCLRVIDELPNQIVEVLASGKSLTFIPVPEPRELELIQAGYIEIDPTTNAKKYHEYPNAEQWAKKLGLDTSYEVPASEAASISESRHQDTKLQTLMYSPELESRCRNIRNKAETAIEESGANILYLVLGFLEWTESRVSQLPRMAPLFTLPVRMEKKKFERGEGTFRYTITLKDDGLLTNVPLREKLSNDFGLILPTLEDDTSPEGYFQRISDTILKEHPNWKIRRQVTLALLNFSKMVMYEDLNPGNWPKSSSIAEHPIISKFFSSGRSEYCNANFGYSEEHPIDDVKNIHSKFPLIYEADSSQHSALIDAVNGENLVIEGPPGTGKSQTITNLIGASIANGKKVLFVAEKMAALDVVKKRLDSAGLGDFCLELHSHKTQKQKILADLQHRVNRQGSYLNPKDIDDDIARFEALKEKLKIYADEVNQLWKNTGCTTHEILHKATRLRNQLNIDPDWYGLEGINGETFTKIKQKELLDQADMLTHVYNQVAAQTDSGRMEDHFWYGVNNHELAGYQTEKLCSIIKTWNENLVQLKILLEKQQANLQLIHDEKISFESLQKVSKDFELLPILLGDEPLSVVNKLSQNVVAFANFLSDYQATYELNKKIKPLVLPEIIGEMESLKKVKRAVIVIDKLGAADHMTLQDLAATSSLLDRLITCTLEIQGGFDKIKPNLPPELFVAFDVSAIGLQEFLILDDLISKLPKELWRNRAPLYDEDDLDPILKNLTARLAVLCPMHKKLVEVFSLHRLPDSETISANWELYKSGGFFKILSSRWRSAKKELLLLAPSAKQDKRKILNLIPQLINYSKGLTEIENLNQEDPLLGDLYRGVETPLDKIILIRKWYKEVRQQYGQGFGERVPIGNSLFDLDRNIAQAIHEFSEQGLGSLCKEVVSGIEILKKRFSKLRSFKNPKHDLTGDQSKLTPFKEAIETLLGDLLKTMASPDTSFSQVSSISKYLEEFYTRKKDLDNRRTKLLLDEGGLQLSVDSEDYSQQKFDAAKNLLTIAEILYRSPTIKNALTQNPTKIQYEALRSAGYLLSEKISQCQDTKALFIEMGQVNETEWLDPSSAQIDALINKNKNAINNPNWLETWLEYLRLKNRLSQKGLGSIIGNLEEGHINAQDLSSLLSLCVYHLLAKEILAENRIMAEFSGLEQNAIRSKFSDYDRKLLKLQQEKIAFRTSQVTPPAGISNGRVSDYTEMGLVNQEIGKKKRHIAVRSLIRRSGRAIQSLKPCFMMSPMSVAQYLEPGQFNFDLVVMDEASQIKPEDALGAIARGNNLVVVGDPKQLPPTSFFQRVIEEDVDEDLVALQESESILESVIPMFKNRRLRWHYRSRHESLIEFSNQNFYDSDLIIFPSPFQEAVDLGVRFEKVYKGRFHNRRNVEEAKQIVAAVAEQLVRNPEESVGIVAMNSEQKDEIEIQLDQLIKEDGILRAAIEKKQVSEEPYFIKNLENVQGDERDVIYISMTYGPEQIGGRTMQRFGPINSSVGWRRLNVLFTRSKKRMQVFSSMGAGDILVSSTSSRGVQALRAFLEYCESGHLYSPVHTGKPADSDFEIAVMKKLSDHGYESVPQLGVAGYFLDLAVRDPGKSGRFLMGIECDGATYHSAKSVRDRDRLRQEILEGLGWKISRIWSTDWFNNSDACLMPILNSLDLLKTPISDTAVNENIDYILEEISEETDPAKLQENETELGDIQKIEDPVQLLKEKLLDFEKNIIEKESTEADADKKLLRPAMLESLLTHMPCSKAEFLEFIPGHLRFGTAASEGKYVSRVCEIIADYGI